MQQSKLISLLKSLEAKEIRRLDDYLRSPFFGIASEALDLWAQLMPLAPAFPANLVDKYRLFGLVHPGAPLPTDADMARTMNQLMNKVEDYLAVETLLATPSELELESARVLGARGLTKHYNSSLKRCIRSIAAFPYRDEQWHYLRYQQASIELGNLRHRQDLSADLFLDDMASELDSFYLAARLRIAREILNRQNIRSGAIQAADLDPLWNLLESSAAKSSVAVQLHAQVLKMIVEPEDTQHFKQLQALNQAHGKALTTHDRVEILTVAQNYCIRQIRMGDQTFLRSLFDLYQEAIQDGILLEGGEISPWKFKNISSVGLQLGEYEWVERFIHDFRAFLPEAFRENAFAYNLADLQYHRAEYQKALRTLLQVEFTDMVYALDTRKLQLKIFYEQGATEPMLSLVNAFRTYLVRHKLIAEETRKAYLNFISLVHTIWKSDMDGRFSHLGAEIEGTQPLVEEAWLSRMARKLGE